MKIDTSKQIRARHYHFKSKLGEGDFSGVPVWVEDRAVSTPTFEQDVHEHYLDGETIQVMSREIAKIFYMHFIKGNRTELTPDELAGIRIIFDLNQTDFANLLAVAKGTISRAMRGGLKLTKPVIAFLMELFYHELQKPGYAKKNLARRMGKAPQVILKTEFELKRA